MPVGVVAKPFLMECQPKEADWSQATRPSHFLSGLSDLGNALVWWATHYRAIFA